jgi:hypothetical protein
MSDEVLGIVLSAVIGEIRGLCLVSSFNCLRA